MTDRAQLTASIETAGPLKVGPEPNTGFRLRIENRGAPVTRAGSKGANLYLTGVLGPGADALFFDRADARKCDRACDPPGWRTDWMTSDEGWFRLRISTFDDVLFGSGDALTITFSNVVSRTAAGSALLKFETDFTDGAEALALEKRSDDPGIISFDSVPPQGVPNLPGADVKLRWCVNRLNNLELIDLNTNNALPCDFSGPAGTRTISGVQADMQLRLRGYDGMRPIDRVLGIRVLRTGWYDLAHTLLEGDPGYPVPRNEAEARALAGKTAIHLEPSVLATGGEQDAAAAMGQYPVLYGIFRHDALGAPRALLFATQNPFGAWRFIASTVPGEEGCVPAGFDGSPGAFSDGKLWLIGGSQIDPDVSSNRVWCCDPVGGAAWEDCGAAPWRSRMGHAVLVLDGRIWLMGGRDEAGNALNDVWILDPRAGNSAWEAQTGSRPWAPRCLFSPAVFQGRVWLYGGVREPFSDRLYDDLYVCEAGTWRKIEMTGIIAGDGEPRRPIAACLQTFNDALHLFGTFRTIRRSDGSEIVEQLAFRLSSPTTRTWTIFPADGLQNWGADTTFSYQAVSFGGVMLIAKALTYGAPTRVLKAYVPPVRRGASIREATGDRR
jgi:hypothetical protein